MTDIRETLQNVFGLQEFRPHQQDIIEQQTGSMLTDECSACYGESVACSTSLCATSGCATQTSPSCIECQCYNDCTPGFDRCSGLPPNGDCG